jgi:hypothetical protein
MEDLETKAFSSFTHKPEVFFRYIDDIFFEWPEFECSTLEFYVHLNNHKIAIFSSLLKNNGKNSFS